MMRRAVLYPTVFYNGISVPHKSWTSPLPRVPHQATPGVKQPYQVLVPGTSAVNGMTARPASNASVPPCPSRLSPSRQQRPSPTANRSPTPHTPVPVFLDRYKADYSKYEPLIVAHKTNPKMLFCKLTGTKLNRVPAQVEAHVNGKRFRNRKLEMEGLKQAQRQPVRAGVDPFRTAVLFKRGQATEDLSGLCDGVAQLCTAITFVPKTKLEY